MANPCFCGCSLQKSSTIIAIVDMVFAVLSAALILPICIASFVAIAKAKKSVTEDGKTLDSTDSPDLESLANLAIGVVVVVLIIGLAACIVSFAFGIVLKRGSDNKDAGLCRNWLIAGAVSLSFNFIVGILFLGVLSVYSIPGIP